jgi:hypothetical protein
MVNVALERASTRQIRLFRLACCELLRGIIPIEHYVEWIALLERVAEGRGTFHDAAAVSEVMHELGNTWAYPQGSAAGAFHWALDPDDAIATTVMIQFVSAARGRLGPYDLPIHNWSDQPRLLRDIFGNPFRPVQFDSRWRTSNVVDLTRTINEERTFERLPILADALMDAGCADEQILKHCRSKGPHLRGCWAVDLILGKQ